MVSFEDDVNKWLHCNVCAYKLSAAMPVCVFLCVYTLQMTYRDLLQRTLTIFQPQSFIVTFFTNEASEWVVGRASSEYFVSKLGQCNCGNSEVAILKW